VATWRGNVYVTFVAGIGQYGLKEAGGAIRGAVQFEATSRCRKLD
jgi:hypothetical protein